MCPTEYVIINHRGKEYTAAKLIAPKGQMKWYILLTCVKIQLHLYATLKTINGNEVSHTDILYFIETCPSNFFILFVGI